MSGSMALQFWSLNWRTQKERVVAQMDVGRDGKGQHGIYAAPVPHCRKANGRHALSPAPSTHVPRRGLQLNLEMNLNSAVDEVGGTSEDFKSLGNLPGY